MVMAASAQPLPTRSFNHAQAVAANTLSKWRGHICRQRQQGKFNISHPIVHCRSRVNQDNEPTSQVQ
jgi:hypothetical protein